MNLIFDIETNGLYHDCTQVHCIGVYDIDADQILVFNDTGSQQPLSKGVQLLEDADVVIGHNVVNYDIPVLSKLFPWFDRTGDVIDTLILSRCYHADLFRIDLAKKWEGMPGNLWGRHSLESWGHRLGEHKGEFGKTADWSEWSQEMEDYMIQDLRTTHALWKHFLPYLNGSR